MARRSFEVSERRRALSFSSLVLVAILAALLPLIFVSRSSFSSYFIDLKGPVIKLLEPHVRGIGLAPVTLEFELSDPIAGIKEVTVWTKQNGELKEVLKRQIPRRHVERVSVNIEGAASGLREGKVQIVVRAIDGSWFANSADLVVPLTVDFEKPHLDVFPSEMTALKEGDSNVVLYRARDKQLIITGVKIGNVFFLGYPAKYIDKDLVDPSLLVCLFAVPEAEKQAQNVRLVAEDLVGNSASFTLMSVSRKANSQRVERVLREELLKDYYMKLVDANAGRMEKIINESSVKQETLSENPDLEEMLIKFRLFNEVLRSQNNEEILAYLKASPRFEKYWENSFLKPQGEIKSSFADNIVYTYKEKTLCSYLQTGFEVAVPWSAPDVLAANDGFVAFSGDFGVYGKVLALDHGLGLASLYGNLESISVLRGERVRKGQKIAIAGRTGMFNDLGYLFEMRINGVPIDAEQWWSASGYQSQVALTVENVKRSLGIPVFKPIDSNSIRN